MEVGIVATLEKHIADAKDLPKVRAALSNHLKQTKRHATEMKKALAALGGSHPVIREGLSKVANLAAGLMTSAATDTVIKNAIADFATEHFEIACYTSLMLTATELGETKITATCKAILKEEQAMAAKLEEQFPGLNRAYLGTLEDDETSDREPRRPKRSLARSTSARGKKTGKAVPKR